VKLTGAATINERAAHATSVEPLNFGGQIGDKSHSVGGILTFENPGGFVRLRELLIPLSTDGFGTDVTLVAYLSCDDLRGRFWVAAVAGACWTIEQTAALAFRRRSKSGAGTTRVTTATADGENSFKGD